MFRAGDKAHKCCSDHLASVTSEKGCKVNLSNELPIQAFLPCRKHQRHFQSQNWQISCYSNQVPSVFNRFSELPLLSHQVRPFPSHRWHMSHRVQNTHLQQQDRVRLKSKVNLNLSVNEQESQDSVRLQSSWFVAPPTGSCSLVAPPPPPLLWHAVAAVAGRARSQGKQPSLERYKMTRCTTR